LAVFKVMWRDT